MTAERSERIEALFHAALDCRPSEREAFLEKACEGDPSLKEEVESLLEAREEDEEFLAEPAWSILTQPPMIERPDAETTPAEPGLPFDRLGEFRLLGRLGEGGMGVVYLAVQESLGRKVALKVIRPERMGSFEAQARFSREVEAITGLRHPNIVTVYGSGRERGVSYFAMEFVPGKGLNDLLREILSKKEKVPHSNILEWIRDIALALDSAHETGIIHRDVKPSNILITPEGRAMLMDFGVARHVNLSTLTVTGEFRGTPHYASPEQIRARRQRITALTDVYSLGVTLYEAATGRVPFEGETTEQVFHKILGEDPLPPRRLNASISRDLETVILKAMEKDAGRRYAGMADFAADLERLMKGEMISAKPAGVVTRARRQVKRHPVLSTAVLVTLAAGISFASYLLLWSYPRLKAEQDEAKRIGDFLEATLASADPWTDGKVVRVVEMLDKTAGRIDEALPDQPEVQSSLRETLGKTYMNLGRYGEAEAQYRAALEIRRRLLGDEHYDTLNAMTQLANSLVEQGKWSEAESIRRDVLAVKRRVLGEEHPSTLLTMGNLAVVLKNQSRLDEAEFLQGQAYQARRRVLGAEHMDTLQSMGNLAVVFKDQGRFEEAESLQREVTEIEKRIFGGEHPETLSSMHNLANVLMKLGKHSEAESIQREVLDVRLRVLGDEHPKTLSSMTGLALTLKNQNKLPEAEELFRRALETQRNVLGEEHAHTLATMTNLGNLLRAKGALAEAEDLLRESLETGLLVLGESHRGVLIILDNLTFVLLIQEKLSEAEPYLMQGIELAQRSLPRERVTLARLRAHYGECLYHMKRYPEAERMLLDAREGFRVSLGDGHNNTQYAQDLLDKLYGTWERPEDEN